MLDARETRLFFAASVVTMLVTPFALRLGPHLAAGAARLRGLDRLLGLQDEAPSPPPEGLSGHVMVLGYGVGGEMLAEVLRAADLPHVVIDINAERVRRARERGEPVYYGDVTSRETLERARVGKAGQVAVLVNDPDATVRAVRSVRALAPQAAIVARARYVADVPRLLRVGATEAVAQEFEASLEVIERVMKRARPAATALARRLPRGLEVTSFPVRDGASIAGRTLAEARLRTRTGATLVAVSRGEATAVHPAPDDILRAGDVLCLVGDGAQVEAACALLESGPAS